MDCAVTLCNTILINRVIRVIRALKNLFYSVVEKLKGPSNPAGSNVFSALRYFALVQMPSNGAFPSSAPVSAFAQVFVTSISSSLVPFFRAPVIFAR